MDKNIPSCRNYMSCSLNDASYFFTMSTQRVKGDCIQHTYEDYQRLYPVGYALLDKRNVRQLAATAGVVDMTAASALWRVYTQIYMPTITGRLWNGPELSTQQWLDSLYSSALSYLARKADEDERLRRVYARLQTKPVLEARQVNPRPVFRDREVPGIGATTYNSPYVFPFP